MPDNKKKLTFDFIETLGISKKNRSRLYTAIVDIYIEDKDAIIAHNSEKS